MGAFADICGSGLVKAARSEDDMNVPWIMEECARNMSDSKSLAAWVRGLTGDRKDLLKNLFMKEHENIQQLKKTLFEWSQTAMDLSGKLSGLSVLLERQVARNHLSL